MSRKNQLKIARILTSDSGGGVARVAERLHKSMRKRGHADHMFVGRGQGDQPNLTVLDNRKRKKSLLGKLLVGIEHLAGMQYLYFPGTRQLLPALREFDVIHLHNLHGDYFELHQLPKICAGKPALLTLHDSYMMTGHCAQPVDCPRWAQKCGQCPDLARYPSLHRDTTAFYREYKKRLLQQCDIQYVAPSRWMKSMWTASGLTGKAPRVIPRGVDLDLFHPKNKQLAKLACSFSPDEKIIMFSAQFGLDNPYKDGKTILKAVDILKKKSKNKVRLVVLGGQQGQAKHNDVFFNTGYLAEETQLVPYYQAADILVHATRADTSSLVTIEAMACGLPAVVTDVGGVPELVDDGTTGFVVPPRDPLSLAEKIQLLLANEQMLDSMARESRRRACKFHDLESFADKVERLYYEQVERAAK